MKTIQDEILLVIPYIKSTQGRELELSLTGWRKYCTSPLRIIVIGEYDPCIEGKAEFIEAPRAENLNGQYMPNIDVARKLDMIYERFHNEYDHFVLANDDEYPVRPFDWSFLTQVTYLQTSFIGNLSAPTNYWSHDMGKTRVILDKLRKPHVNYCNHHPFYFDMETFHKMSQGFDLANNSLIRENLYYNIYHEGATKNVNDIRYGFWDTKSTKENFRKNISNKNIVFMCNSVAGWSEELMNILDEHYNGVGRFVDNVEPIVSSNNDIQINDTDIISFIIPNRGGTAIDKVCDNIKEVYKRYNKEIIIIEQADDSIFKKGQLYNIAVKNCNGTWIALCDNDIIHFNEIDLFGQYKRFKNSPFLGFDATTQVSYSNGKLIKNSTEKRPWGYGAFFFMHKNDFLKVNGFSNIYLGWGAEDTEFGARISNCKSTVFTPNVPRLKQSIGHITHPRRQNINLENSNLNHSYYKSRNSRDPRYDGYLQTVGNIVSDTIIDDVRYIKVNNIGVTKNFKYMDLLNAHLRTCKNEVNLEFIISLTSFPERIQTVDKVISSILQTTVDKRLYKIVLVLSLEEFPNKEKDLPRQLINVVNSNDNVEILWHPRNIRSHKKLIPTLKKYPNIPILCIDDDIERNSEWLQMFIDDHRRYPKSIITMRCDYHIHKDLTMKNEYDNFIKNVPLSSVVNDYRPANGCGGIFYPANTFVDKEFFNEDLLMRLSPSSDEMWQFCFNVMNDQEIRRTSKFFSVSCIPGTQKKSLHEENKLKYTKIFNDLLEYFPRFKENLLKRINK